MTTIGNLRKRVDKLRAVAAGGGDGDVVDVTVHHVHHDGGVTIMDADEWEQYRREHPSAEFITIRETDDGVGAWGGIVPRWDGGTRIRDGKRRKNLPGGG